MDLKAPPCAQCVWTVHSGGNRHNHWVTWTELTAPTLAFPRGYRQIHSTHCAGSTLPFRVAHHAVPSLWTCQTFQVMRIGIQDCLIEALQSRMQTPLRYTFILYYLPPWSHLSGCLTQLVQNAWEAFNPSAVVSEQMQHSLEICTVTVVARGVCRTVNEADLDSGRCWFSQSPQSGKMCILCWSTSVWMSWTDTAQEPDSFPQQWSRFYQLVAPQRYWVQGCVPSAWLDSGETLRECHFLPPLLSHKAYHLLSSINPYINWFRGTTEPALHCVQCGCWAEMKMRNEYLIVDVKKDDAVIKEMLCMVSVHSKYLHWPCDV